METYNVIKEKEKSKAQLSLEKYSDYIDHLVENGTITDRRLVGSIEPDGDGYYNITLIFPNREVTCTEEKANEYILKTIKDIFEINDGKVIISKTGDTITLVRERDGLLLKTINLIKKDKEDDKDTGTDKEPLKDTDKESVTA